MKRLASLTAIPASAIVIGLGLSMGSISAWDAIRDPDRHEAVAPHREAARIGIAYLIWAGTVAGGVAAALRTGQAGQ